MEKRRQNHSCEQCRKAKKACDGFLVNSGKSLNMQPTWSDLRIENDLHAVASCSYCLRTKKSCSLNPQWVRINRLRHEKVLSCSRDIELDNTHHQDKRQRIQSPPDQSEDLLTPSHMASTSESFEEFLYSISPENDSFGWDALSAPGASHSVGSTAPDEGTVDSENCSVARESQRISSVATSDHRPIGPTTHHGLDTMDPASVNSASNTSVFESESLISYNAFPFVFDFNPPVASTWEERCEKELWGQHEDNDLNNSQPYSVMPLSPFGTDYMAMENSNRSLISDSLLRIYHDVLENNLGCWLAEDNCPYKMRHGRQEQLSFQQESMTRVNVQPEWGPTWSNRMYRRVKQLDRSAQSIGLINLTSPENRAASKALELVIMAFATQWSQSGQRPEDPWSDDGFPDERIGRNEGLNEFEQTLQRSIWERANQTLQNVSDVECFRVVFAELIFGLVQKPPSDDKCYGWKEPVGNENETGKPSTLSRIKEIMAQDAPPIYLERGTRKIHALRCRIKRRQAGFQGFVHNHYAEESPRELGAEETRTVGLLYWLGIMFDTVSSSMNERPVVVADEECQHEAAQEVKQDIIRTPILNRRWELDLYAQEDTKNALPLRWPCTYEAVTRAVSRSAGVKVLLFRYLSYIQKALRMSEHPQDVEEIIKLTIYVYRYWMKTHGALFRDLTKNYDSVPPRIKSWFPCIGIPWHLGSLMLADLIEFIDINRLGRNEFREQRQNACLVWKIRKESSIDLSELATVLMPGPLRGIGFSQLPGFHFAVNESPLLTEPWTILLVRAFSKASLFHLEETERLRQSQRFAFPHENNVFQESVARVESCATALRFLGAKSATAEAISVVLYRGLVQYRNMMVDKSLVTHDYNFGIFHELHRDVEA